MVANKVPTALILRCCAADMGSKNGFIWPGVGGIATAPDWRDDSECGHGLHGWLYGQGDHGVSDHSTNPEAKWLVVEVAESDIRMLGGKCKFPSGAVVFVGLRSEAANYIIAHEPRAQSVAVIGLVREVGDNGVAEGGALATLTGGDGAELRFQFYDEKANRYRTKLAYVGEDGIEANVAYRLSDSGMVVKVQS